MVKDKFDPNARKRFAVSIRLSRNRGLEQMALVLNPTEYQ